VKEPSRERQRATAPLPTGRRKPRLRGVFHEIAAFVAAPAALALVVGAETARAKMAAAVYGATLVAQFLVSAVYHRPDWTPRGRGVLERVDHSLIFLFTAGTYTPLCLRLGPGAGHVLLLAAWVGAALGVVFSVAWVGAPKPLRAGIHVLLGWSFLPFAAGMHSALGGDAFQLLVGGTLVYTAGAIVFTLRRPDPFPDTLGFHEIFHLLVIAGAACHYVAVRSVLRVLG
jgi:hemolysin III